MPTAERTEPRICEECHREFLAWKRKPGDTRGRFCSHACSAKVSGRKAVRHGAMKRTPHERVLRHVVTGDECWEWLGQRNPKGYGVIWPHKLAHRVAWELHNGPIPDSLCVCHRCDNPPCVRPDHLFLGTRADNNTDMRQKGRGGWAPKLRGESHPQAKLTNAIAAEIRARRSAGSPVKMLAREYGVGLRLITDIAFGRRYAA